jgi:hypothetical protein
MALLAPGVFLFFTACGGGDSNPPPPNPVKESTAVDQQMLTNLYDHAQRAKASCAQDYTPVFVQLAATYMAAPRPACNGGIGGPIPGPSAGVGGAIPQGMVGMSPPTAGMQPAQTCGAPVLPVMPTPQPQSGACKNDLMNLIMTFTTIKLSNGTLYANLPEAQQWLMQTMGGLLNRVGGNVMAQVPGAPMGDPAFLGFMLANANNVASSTLGQLPSGIPMQLLQQGMGNVPPQVMQYLAQYSR